MFGNKEKNQRFIRILRENIDSGAGGVMSVYVDTETGIQYIHIGGSYEGGMTVLLDENGKPCINEEYRRKEK